MNGLGVVISRRAGGERRALEALLDAQRRRGPDGSAAWSEPGAALGRTIAFITSDDRRDAQPLIDPSGRWVLVADARIHNREELSAELGATEVLGDAEVILRAYLRWGERTPDKLLGDFAFAIWDRQRRVLFCARDPIGIRPLYYSLTGGPDGALLVASEMRALVADPRVSREPDETSLALYVTRVYEEWGQTLFRDVMSLPGGYALKANDDGVALCRYHRVDTAPPLTRASDDDRARAFSDLFGRAVRSRISGATSVGAEVSGGVDSSAVACEAAASTREQGRGAGLELFTLRFPGLDCDETEYSEAVASWVGAPMQPIVAEQRLATLERTLEVLPPDTYYDPMLAVSGLMLDEAREAGCRLVLTGTGGDELFWHTGVETAAALWAGDFREAWDVGLAETWRRPSSWARLGRDAIRLSMPRPARRAHRRVRGLPRSWAARLEPAAARLAIDKRLEVSEWMEGEGLEGARTMVARSNGRPDAKLSTVRVDRIAAHHGAEYAHPLCDRRLTDLCVTLPYRQRVRRGLSKVVMRRALSGRVPPAILERRDKPGFLDFTQRIFALHRSALRPIFAQSELEKRGILRPGAALQLLDDGDEVTMAVHVAAMELWLRDVRTT